MKWLRRLSVFHTLALLVSLALFGLASKASAYETKSSKANRVQVEVKPVQLATGKPANFEVRMNTHSVGLDQDLTAVSVLKDDHGREYQPAKWQGSPPGGHHRSGVLAFPPLEGNPKSVTLIIRTIADVTERSFKWQVK
jgi:hypothetical protein